MDNVQHSVPIVKMVQCKDTISMWNKQQAVIGFLTAENVPPNNIHQ
jgi:hypothetical protein